MDESGWHKIARKAQIQNSFKNSSQTINLLSPIFQIYRKIYTIKDKVRLPKLNNLPTFVKKPRWKLESHTISISVQSFSST